MGGPIKIGSVTIDTIGQLKVGSANVQQAYVGSVLVFPATTTTTTSTTSTTSTTTSTTTIAPTTTTTTTLAPTTTTTTTLAPTTTTTTTLAPTTTTTSTTTSTTTEAPTTSTTTSTTTTEPTTSTTTIAPTTTTTSTTTSTTTETPTTSTTTSTTTAGPTCCYQYEITNYYTTSKTIFYTDCNGTPSSISAPGNGLQTYINCAIEGSISFSETPCDGGSSDCIAVVQANEPCGGCVSTTTTSTTTSTTTAEPTTTTTTSTTTSTTTAAPVGLWKIDNTSDDLDISGINIGGSSGVVTVGAFPSTPSFNVEGTTQLITIPGTHTLELVTVTSGITGQIIRVTDSNGTIQTQTIPNPNSGNITFTGVYFNTSVQVLIECLPAPPPTTTTTSTTTTTTTEEPTTTSTTTTTTTSNEVSIYINNTNSLDVPITDMTINGETVTFVGGSNFTITAGNNGSFSSTELGTQTVIIYYSAHTSGQNIAFTDSDSTVSCQNLSGGAGSFTISNAVIDAGTTIYVTVSDGACS